MVIQLINSFKSEWLKKKNSAADWLTLVGGFFIPLIILGARIYDFKNLALSNEDPKIWEQLYTRSWQFMALLLLPMGVILATSLITQIEYRNNAWKQVHCSPQHFSTVFAAKLFVIVIMLLQLFVLFNVGIYLSGIIPACIFPSVPFPIESYPFRKMIVGNAHFFVACLPIVAIQYLISLQCRNFLIPIGIGFALYVASVVAGFWKFGYLFPYGYSMYTFMESSIHTMPWDIFFYLPLLLIYCI